MTPDPAIPSRPAPKSVAPKPKATLRSAATIAASATANPSAAANARPTETTQPLLPSMSSSYPVLLLPVRIETRYVNTPSVGLQLYLRVFPDQIHVNSLQYALTPDEQAAGAIYQSQNTPGADPDALQALRRSMVARYGLPRTEWILQSTSAASSPGTLPSTPCFGALPDQFVLFAYDTVNSDPPPVAFPSSVSTDLSPAPSPANLPAGNLAKLPIDPDAAWLSDFSAAQQAGMAMIYPPDGPLSTAEQQNGFYRLIVLGLRAHENPAAAQATLEALLNAHRYSDGLALVPQGTPTKNSSAARSGLSSQAGAQQAALETAFPTPPLASPPSFALDGQVLVNALGIDPSVVTNVPGALGTDHQDALDMMTALWPGTAGYYLSDILGASAAEVTWVQNWAQSNLFGRGGLPALRVGSTPYGILPVTSLDQWPTSDPDASRGQLARLLLLARTTWARSAASVPRIGLTSNPDNDLIQTLATIGTPGSYLGRFFLGPYGVSETGQYTGRFDSEAYLEAYQTQFLNSIGPLLTSLGLPQWSPYLAQFCGSYASFGLPNAVRDDGVPLSETGYLPNLYSAAPGSAPSLNYIAWLAQASVEAVSQNSISPTVPQSLLYGLLRQSFLLEASQLYPSQYPATAFGADSASGASGNTTAAAAQPGATKMVAKSGLAGAAIRPGVNTAPFSDAELQGFSASASGTAFEAAPLPVTGAGSIPTSTFLAGVYNDALQDLSQRTTAELGRLLGEILDVFSTRYDAWVTSLAYSQLQGMAEGRSISDDDSDQPEGLFLGSFGWIDGLPAPAATSGAATVTPALQGINQQIFGNSAAPSISNPGPNDGGFIYAPSIDQAAAAAVLRTAYISHYAESGGSAFAVDLSSRRVRWALELLQGIQQGYSLGALLGYRFEEMLGNDPDGAAGAIPAIRAAYPLHPGTVTQPTSAAQTPPQVTNGLQLQRAYAAGNFQWPSGVSTTQYPNLPTYLTRLDDLVDAIGDVTLSEGVFQMLRGNPTRSGAVMDVLGGGLPPAEIEFVRTPVSGTRFDHRVLVLLNGTSRATAESGPRASAEPRLEAWLESLLPDPGVVRCEVTFSLPTGDGPTQLVSWKDLGVGALDLLSMAGTQDTPQDAELERRIISAAIALQTGPTAPYLGGAGIGYAPQAGWPKGSIPFPTLLATVRLARDLIGAARPLTPSDVYVPCATRASLDDPAMNSEEIVARATNAYQAVQTLAGNLTTAVQSLTTAVGNPTAGGVPAAQAGLRTLLAGGASYGVPGAMPPSPPVPTPSVSAVQVTAPAPTAGNTTSDWTIELTLSPVGALAVGASITVTAPPGCVLPAPLTGNTNYGVSVGGSNQAPATVRRPIANQIVIYPAEDLPASAVVTLTIQGVTPSAPAGSYFVNVFTTADPMAATSTAPVSIGGAGPAPVSGASVVANPSSETWTYQFSVGAAGLAPTREPVGMVSALEGEVHVPVPHIERPATISLQGPPGTVFPPTASGYAVAYGETPVALAAPPAISGPTVVLKLQGSIPANATVIVSVYDVPLPLLPGIYGCGIATSSQPTVAGVALLVDGSAALLSQASQVGQALQTRLRDAFANFVAPPVKSGRGRPGATQNRQLAAPPKSVSGSVAILEALFGRGFTALPVFTPWDPTAFGPGFPTGASFLNGDSLAVPRWVQQNSYLHSGISQADLVLSLSALLQKSAGATAPWTVGQLPALPNDRWLALPLPPRLLNVSVSVGAVTGGAASYTIQFSTSPTGALAAGGSITLIAPAGTVWPALSGSNYTLSVQQGGSVQTLTKITANVQGSQVVIGLTAGAIPASAVVTITVAGVQNPAKPAPANSIVAFTSSDAAGAPSASYALASPPATGSNDSSPGPILPNAARVSLVALPGTATLSAVAAGTQALAGLYLDGWVEEIPNANLVAGLAVHHTDPRAQAPQTWLLAVPPPIEDLTSWTEDGYDLLLAIVDETLDLVKTRGVDLRTLSNGGQLLPAVFAPVNASGSGGLPLSPPGSGASGGSS